MKRHYTAALLITLTIAGCSQHPAPKLPYGALPGGTAQISVNGKDTGRVHDVACESIGKGLTRIKIGEDGKQTTVLVGDGRTPKQVAFDDVEGFTGSYWQDLQGSARLDMVDQTYSLTGTAAGFNAEQPYVRTTYDFTVKVAC